MPGKPEELDMAETTTETYEEALARFVETTQANITRYYEANYSNVEPSVLSLDPNGKKYQRVVVTNHGSRSVFCFVEKSSGNVLKAAGWKGPAKHARGTIYGEASGYGVTAYGAQYR